ncbi:MAG: 5'/3'-nucleotidase SurE [Bacteroidota bacterium]|nr:5'/3'-nucleotidase SurE [Bacteroidota bacterium]
MKAKPLILVTNDDGITAKGIHTLVALMDQIGKVIVVAPDSPQSGMGHAITVKDPLRLEKSEEFGEGIEAYTCSGTPADCVKLAKHMVLKDRGPDIVVSGINHGSNSSISVIYSGTMSAAIEAAIEGIPSIGFSLCDYGHNADFSHVGEFVKMIVKEALEQGIPKYVALNVNFPEKKSEPIKGIKVCRQSNAKWQEEFEERKDPSNKSYYWMTGEFINMDKGEDTDEWAIANNFISVVPCQFDLTAHHAISILNSEWRI